MNMFNDNVIKGNNPSIRYGGLLCKICMRIHIMGVRLGFAFSFAKKPHYCAKLCLTNEKNRKQHTVNSEIGTAVLNIKKVRMNSH